MLTEAFGLILQLQPMAFSPVSPSPWTPPKELACDIRDLGKPVYVHPLQMPNLPRFAPPKAPRVCLVGPKTDAALTLAAMLIAGSTGGSVDLRPPEVKLLEQVIH
jgi:hypothetical protein